MTDNFQGQANVSSPQISISEYSRRMNKVLDHIDRHLDTPLDLAALAEVAHFSPFHFHRVFAGWMGETLGAYLRRRRLEKAALMLAGQPAIAVLNAALSVGFGSGEAFARAFKLHFGCTPTAWQRDTPRRWAEQLETVANRQYRKLDQLVSKQSQEGDLDFTDNADSQPLIVEMKMNVEIVELPAANIVYMRHIGPYGPSVSAFWKQAFIPWMQANGLTDRACYGIGHDDPSITPPEKCRYDACVEVDEGFIPSGNAVSARLPGGRYAVTKFQGRAADIGDAWTELFRDWLPSSGLQCDSRPCFEHYPRDTQFDPETGVFTCDICIAVRSL
jgi:AraC family transcriptional regulator